MTMVTAVTYGHYADDTDEMRLTLYVVPVGDYRPGMKEEEAASVATRVDADPSAPGARGVENFAHSADGKVRHALTSCGHGHTWDDALVTDRTPTPAGRCPWEHLHEPDDDETDAPQNKVRMVNPVTVRVRGVDRPVFASAFIPRDGSSAPSHIVLYRDDEDEDDPAGWAVGTLAYRYGNRDLSSGHYNLTYGRALDVFAQKVADAAYNRLAP